ncbi:MFS transporter [Streptomyces malaysiensis]|uniref:MFS transporter n=1 Tax=Streptomyces malaysiensis subsp. samsunensis TaxID=459658 RepID=A0A9X2LWL4_STRMQ|nr:MFS transporter [Streptomyces samsunensis]MCQ8831047.1 MFS transporter [Streptomyces samsunensis]
MSPPPEPDGARLSGRAWGVLFVLCGAIFLEGIDVAMLNVALPSIRVDLGMSTGELQWVMSAYVVGYGGFMLLGGRAADLFGRRRTFLLWLTVFLLFSGLGGFAEDGSTLIVARFVTGVAAAFMTPAGLVIGIDAALSPTLTPRLVNRFGNARVIFGGLVLAVLSYALFLPVGDDWTYAAMFPSLITLGLAFSLAYGPLTIVATEGIDEEEQGLTGGLLYTAFQFGAALGLSTVTAVNIAATAEGGSPKALLDGYHAALLVPLIAAALAALISAFGLRDRPGAAADDAPRAAPGAAEGAETAEAAR